MTKNYEKPFYTLKITKKDCGLLVVVNGMMVAEWRNGSELVMEFPINQYLKNGENNFDYHLVNVGDPTTGKKGQRVTGEFKIEFLVKENGSDKQVSISETLYSGKNLPRQSDGRKVDFTNIEGVKKSVVSSTTTKQFNVIDNKVEESPEGVFEVGEYTHDKGITKAQKISQKIHLPLPLPLWTFFGADQLIATGEMTEEERRIAKCDLIDFYEEISRVIEDENSAVLESLFAKRSAEYDLAFYKESGQSNFEFVAHILSIAADKTWSLRSIDREKSALNVSHNKLISWISLPGLVMQSRLRFQHSTANLERDVPLFLSKFNGQWEIVR